MTLSDDEKRFIACFFELLYLEVQPKFQNYLSLFSYLDKTNETVKEQKRQISEDDPYFVNLLSHIVHSRNSEKTRIRITLNLKKDGFFINRNFKIRFNAVVDWLLSDDSKSYLSEASRKRWEIKREQREKATAIEREKIHMHYLVNKETFDSNYRNAMVKLATNGFKKSTTKNSSQSSTIDTWGRFKKPKLEDDGNSWREQK